MLQLADFCRLVTRHLVFLLMNIEFEEAAHKREHEYRLHIDQLNADLLSHQLRVCY